MNRSHNDIGDRSYNDRQNDAEAIMNRSYNDRQNDAEAIMT